MCGIAGVLAARGDASRIARAMHAVLGHRGPDGEGIDDSSGAVLCHRRLSIIDLSETGAQPMRDVRGLARITYNGEIYNYRELREECVRRGASFRGTSDTEVILNLYLLDGVAAFGRLNGMYAFALVDDRTGASFLVRDPNGIKPLYYARTEHGIAFASELKALLQAVPFEVDREALQAYLQMDCVPSPMSMVQGVKKVQGILECGGKATALARPLWPHQNTSQSGGFATALQTFDATIRAAVTRHLIADVPVGVFLSGGIDSSIVARVASEVAGRVSTFSIAFDDPSFDESRWFTMAAKAIGSEHHTERFTSRQMLDLVPGVAGVVSEPLADGSIFPTMLLSRFTRQHVKVALSGDGADELFGGYPTHRVIGGGRALATLPRGVRRFIASAAHRLLPVSHANLSFDFKVKKFLGGADRDPVVQNMRWLGSFMAEELPAVLNHADAEAQARLVALWHEPSRGVTDPLEAVLRTDQRFYLQDQVLVKVDRASMASSLEVRVPMLDREMVAFAHGLPAREKRDKALLRAWAARHFPRELAGRPKKGFGAPLAQWFRGPLRSLLRDTLAPDAVARDGFFQPAAVQRLLDDHERGRRDERKRLFNLLMFTLWYRTFRT